MKSARRCGLMEILRGTHSSFFRRIRATLASLVAIPAFLNDPSKAYSYFPDEPRKSRLRIFLDNILWTLRYSDVNEMYFAYGFDRKHGSPSEQYLGAREGMSLIRKANSQAWTGLRGTDYRCLCKDKFVFGNYLKALSFPTPKNLAFYDGSQLIWLEDGAVKGLESLLNVERLNVFCKDALGAHGYDIISLRIEKGRIYIDGTEETFAELKKRIPVPALFQEPLTQHPRMAEIYPGSVNTLRLVTVLRNGEVTFLGAFVRFGAHGRRVDNWGSGGVAVRVNLETGRLFSQGTFKPGKGGLVFAHPETGFRFEGFEVPFFRKALEQAARLHRFFYGLTSIGWDIGITPEGPVFLEGNHGWEVWGMQVIVGGLRSKLRDAIPLSRS